MSEPLSYQPVIVIGAGRSGTNMLRDLLCQADGVTTWPCDEINYIWRHGNVRYPSDELPASAARPEVSRYIRRQFQRLAERSGAQWLVEKTCANTLRVGFVDAVLPEARYVFIVRHGLDAVASAMKRWRATLDIPYLARKARYVPPGDLPYYATRYLGNRVYRLVSRQKRLAFWGPRFDGFEDFLRGHSLEEICAAQWSACVTKADEALSQVDPARVYRVRYEDFVAAPDEGLRSMLAFIGHDTGGETVDTTNVSVGSVGRGARQLAAQRTATLDALLEPALARFAYSLP